MGLATLLRAKRDVELTSLRVTESDGILNGFGVERVSGKLDVSGLVYLLHKASQEQYGILDEDSGVEVEFFDDGRNWVHNRFLVSMPIATHAFRVDVTSDGLSARIRSGKDSKDLSRYGRTLTPYGSHFAVEHKNPLDGHWWELPHKFLQARPFRTGSFLVKEKSVDEEKGETRADMTRAYDRLVKRTATKMLEMVRNIFRTLEKPIPKLILDFSRNNPPTFRVRLSKHGIGEPVIATGFLEDNYTLKVAYIGIAQDRRCPEYEFENIEAKVREYFK